MTRGVITLRRTLPYACLSHVTGGEWAVERNDVGCCTVRSGQATYLPNGVPHRLAMVSDGTTIARWAHFSVLLSGYLDVCTLVEIPNCFEGKTAQRLGEILELSAWPVDAENRLLQSVSRKVCEFELTSLLLAGSQPKSRYTISPKAYREMARNNAE